MPCTGKSHKNCFMKIVDRARMDTDLSYLEMLINLGPSLRWDDLVGIDNDILQTMQHCLNSTKTY